MGEESFVCLFFALYVGIVLAATLRGHKLLWRFVDKHPEWAARSIPHASSGFQHPEKLFFFFRESNVEALRQDEEIWRLRQQVKWLLAAAVGLPPLAIGILLVVALVLTKGT